MAAKTSGPDGSGAPPQTKNSTPEAERLAPTLYLVAENTTSPK
jgi:hypothetical protein